jgi:glucosyl-dolichyl phosphate glucuronosyltransferase
VGRKSGILGCPYQEGPGEAKMSLQLVTAAVCTHNRALDAERCLRALAPQARASGIQLLVVDSGSDSAAAERLCGLSQSHNATYLRVDEPGLSLARNAALASASSDWVVYLDDDTVPHPSWGSALISSLLQAPKDVALVGGKIVPRWPSGQAPAHIDRHWKLLLSCVDDEQSGDVAGGHNICGANLAVRRSAVQAVGGFPTNLGRNGSRLISCEESYLIQRLQASGGRSLYDSHFAVDHCIGEERLSLDWARNRAFWEGVSRVRMLRALGDPVPAHLHVAKLAISLPVLLAMRCFTDKPRAALQFAMARGSLCEQLGWA